MKKLFTFIYILLFPLLLHSSPVGFTIEGINSTCSNNNGSAYIYNRTGVSPFTYLWSTGEITSVITNLSAGTYYATVTDNAGSTATDSIVILDDPYLSNAELYYESMQGLTFPCPGECNGELYLFNSPINGIKINGTGPYSFSITNNWQYPSLFITGNGVNPSIHNVCGDESLDVIVTDSYGCTGNAVSISPYSSDTISYQISVLGACNGISNGRIIIDESLCNFPAGYTVVYSNSMGNFPSIYGVAQIIVLDNLSAGTYTINVQFAGAVQPCGQNFTAIIPDLGNNCGTISGNVYADTFSNCEFDSLEPVLKERLIQFNPGPYYSTSDNSGNYSAHLPYGIYTALTVSNANYHSVCDSSGIVLNSLNDSITNVDLADSIVYGFDPAINLYSSAARPGFSYRLYINEKNLGFDTCTNSTISLMFPSNIIFNACDLPFTAISATQININFGMINSFENKSAVIDFTLPAAITVNSVLQFDAMLTSVCLESNTLNNSSTLNSVVTGSIDPNDKTVWPMNGLDNFLLIDIDSLLTYTIRFQNTGTDTAFNIIVIDTLDMNLNVKSIQFVGSSHLSHWELTGHNILKVYFDNILLPDSSTNEAESHGAFCYKINSKQVSEIGNIPYILNNKADIYFDFNPPVTTNIIFNTLDISVGLNEQLVDKKIKLFPNPTKEFVTLLATNPFQISDIQITDVLGRILYNASCHNEKFQVNVHDFQPGLYFIKVKFNGMNTFNSEVKRLIIK